MKAMNPDKKIFQFTLIHHPNQSVFPKKRLDLLLHPATQKSK